MRKSQRNAWLASLLFLALALAGVLAWWLKSPASETTRPVEPLALDLPSPEPAAPAEDTSRLELVSPPAADEGVPLETTVVHPLVIELELVRPRFVLQADDAPALGSAATARLSGSVHTSGENPVRVEARFVAGPNEGRVLYSDRNGAFGANDLYPGLSLVRITGAGIPGSLREVRLRQERESLLNLGYGRLSVVYGLVKDRAAKPIPGALVTIDGQEAVTADDGQFVFTGMAPGEVIVTVEKQGFAALRQQITVVAASTIEKGRLSFTLERGGRLEVTIADRINVEGQALLYVLPDNLDAERKFPWHKINPVRLYPGGTATIEDLPATGLALRLFHSGAIAKPRTKRVSISADETAHATLNLELAPVVIGVVSQGGKPVSGAIVRLEVPDRVAAMNAAIGGSDYLSLEREVLPNLPTAVQEARTNALGEFVLSANEDVSTQRYLIASSPDGRNTGGAVLRGGEKRVDIELTPLAQGEGELVIQMDGRTQPLPVAITVNGAPRDPYLLPHDKDLHIGGLTAGSWKLHARWSSEELQRDMPIELDGEATIALSLPPGAIVGQDEETRKRAQRR